MTSAYCGLEEQALSCFHAQCCAMHAHFPTEQEQQVPDS